MIFLIGMAHSWAFPSNDFHDSFNNNSTFISIFNDMNQMMAKMHQRFQRLFSLSSFPMHHNDDWIEDRKKLDAIEPICTTTTTTNSSTSMQKSRRKKLRNTQITTCVKKLIIDGKKQSYKEMNITDEKGVLISQSKIYQTISINTNNNTIPINPIDDKNVISY
jgi:hypothetical protein